MYNIYKIPLRPLLLAILLAGALDTSRSQAIGFGNIPLSDLIQSQGLRPFLPVALGDVLSGLPLGMLDRQLPTAGGVMFVLDTVIVKSSKDTTLSVFSFDPQGLVVTDTMKQWRNGTWVNADLDTYLYYKGRSKFRDYHQEWENGQWVNFWRASFIYDDAGKQLAYNYDVWDGTQWAYGSHWTITYDGGGNPAMVIVEDWVNFAWVASWRLSATYDGAGKQLTALLEKMSGSQWENLYLASFSYDSQGKQLVGLLEKWSSGQWVNNWRASLGYNLLGLKVTGLTEQWVGSNWVNSKRATLGYDMLGNEVSAVGEKWVNGAWVNDWRYEISMDLLKGPTSMEFTTWQNSDWAPADNLLMTVDGGLNPFLFTGNQATFTYKPLVMTGVAPQAEGDHPTSFALSQNYPNPFNPATTIQYSLPHHSNVTLTVFNTLGQQVAQLINGDIDAGYHEVQFNANSLASGVYFYRIQAGSFVETKRLMLLK